MFQRPTRRLPTPGPLLILLLCCLLPLVLSAAEPGTTANNGNLPTIEALQSRIGKLESAGSTSESESKELESYRQTLEYLQTAQDEQARALAYKETVDSADQQLGQLRRDLTELGKAADPVLPEKLGIEELTQRYNQALLDRQLAQSRLQELEERQAGERFRPEQSGIELADSKRQLESLDNRLGTEPGSSLPSHQKELLQAQRSLLKNRVYRLEMERLSHIHRMDQLSLQIKLAQTRLKQQEQLVQQLQERISTLQSEEVEQAQQETLRAQEKAAGKHPLIQQYADRNAALSDRLAQLVAQTGRTLRELEQTVSLKDRIRQNQEQVQQQIIIGSLDERPGRLLQKQRSELPKPAEIQRRVEKLRSAIATARLESFQVESDWQALQAELEQEPANGLKPEAMDPRQWQEIRGELMQLLDNRLQLMEKLRTAYGRLEKALSDLSAQQLQLYDRVQQYVELLDRHLLWIPSTGRVGGDTLQHATEGLRWFFSGENWRQLPPAIGNGFAAYPYRVGLVILLFTLLVMNRHRMRHELDEMAPAVGNVTRDSFLNTVKAFAITLLLALPWPMLLSGIGWWLSKGSDTPFIGAVSVGLQRVAALFLVIQLLRYLFIPNGLAEIHFRWHRETGLLIRKNLHWLLPALTPLAFTVGVFEWLDEEAFATSLGRLSLILALLFSALFFHRILNPWSGIGAQIEATRRRRLGRLAYPAALITFLGLTLLSFEGYYYSALNLERMLFASLFAAILVFLVYQLMVRWLLVAERRLALARARAKRQAAQEARVAKEAADAAGEGVPELAEFEAVNLATINEQTRRLLRIGAGLILATLLYLIWEPLTPALSWLNTISLWQYQGSAGEINSISLWDGILALAVLSLTMIAGRNLPGLLEIALLQPLNLDLGNRYAVSTMSRYTIYASGSLLVLNLLGLQWSDVQWLVAAMGVGLGFGLKEIFANFFSGILILFERPIRIGDTVTIGDISGTVSRIRIRATTITDWDNKELVVPNKNFITDPLINWTLSDPITRIVIRVGIAYGSDTEKAHRVMTEVVESNDDVLKDPPPTIFFVGFGDSSLNFDVRVFVSDNLKRMPLLHSLHMSLNRALAEAGIEIPFPQRDLHLRSVDPKINLRGDGES
ncbi:MAG: mechanosensitive ion channel [Sedimenticola sp.]|nr:mechanosensitive ion channel [Sedimenticola sp.]